MSYRLPIPTSLFYKNEELRILEVTPSAQYVHLEDLRMLTRSDASKSFYDRYQGDFYAYEDEVYFPHCGTHDFLSRAWHNARDKKRAWDVLQWLESRDFMDVFRKLRIVAEEAHQQVALALAAKTPAIPPSVGVNAAMDFQRGQVPEDPLELAEATWNGHRIRAAYDSVQKLVWFMGRDIATALGYVNPNRALNSLDPEDSTKRYSLDGRGVAQHYVFISHHGAIHLTIGSHLPEAKPFRRWVFNTIVAIQTGQIEGLFNKLPSTAP